VRKVALILASIAIGFLVPLAIVEIAMRFLPVREAMMAVPVNGQSIKPEALPPRSSRPI